MKTLIERLKAGIITDNPAFMQVLGMCPTLAVTTSANNAIGMGLATTAVLLCSNTVISLLRKCIPSKVRIPAFIVIIASFVTMIDLLLQAYIPALHAQLGLFLPLIVVNCLILGRAEAYASKNKVLPSLWDGLGMGLGFTIALTMIGVVREILGAGTILGLQVMPASYDPAIIMILAPGAFFTLAIIMAILNALRAKKK
ncbi:electron transport complex subunit E [Niameybacter massiliensis]|uniref:Ion-translocating oxidoreductase complex subunit E n=1 Tax=Holtiella tumoricola TaxID=3018743 RepID=A0AA42DSG0_9FIRM|nr:MULTISPECIES: electron transport complex subunit E [Lachnospirales]MDA3733662.1 electron transport complex subunit E [Holtiella tumoricola]